MAVRHLKRYAEDRGGQTSGDPVVPPGALPGSYVWNG